MGDAFVNADHVQLAVFMQRWHVHVNNSLPNLWKVQQMWNPSTLCALWKDKLISLRQKRLAQGCLPSTYWVSGHLYEWPASQPLTSRPNWLVCTLPPKGLELNLLVMASISWTGLKSGLFFFLAHSFSFSFCLTPSSLAPSLLFFPVLLFFF